MAIKVLGATPSVIDTLKKAKDLVNRQSVAVDQSPVKNRTSVSVSANYTGKAVAARILIRDFVGGLVLVNLNTKYIHGIIMNRHAMVVAAAPPAIPKTGTMVQQRTAVTMEPNIRMYIGILGFPIP